MPSIEIERGGALKLANDLAIASVTAGVKAFETVRVYGELTKGRIIVNASGRPGPRRVTGDYTRSWSVITVRTLADVTALIGTNAPQGRRLEYGFTGVDAIGRHYDQPPYPHARPALDSVAEPFLAALAAIRWIP